MSSKTSRDGIAFFFEIMEGDAVLVDEVVVPGNDVTLYLRKVVGYELLDSSPEFTDGLGKRLIR